MRRFSKKALAILSILLLSTGFMMVRHPELLFAINKSLTIFGEVFRLVSLYYVDEIDPEKFIQVGLEEMLNYLDPYTQYVTEDESGTIDMLTTGRYGGFGISVGRLDSMLVILNVMEGYGADKAGLQRGDFLYKVDSVIVLHLPPGKLRSYTYGKPGTEATVVVLRGPRPDTLTFRVRREEIHLENVSYFGMVDTGIGYIRLERFSQKAPREVKEALEQLKAQDSLRGLILDLRNNPGGLLESAVAITEFFVPLGSTIVSTIGRDSSERRVYISDSTPLDTTLPLVVLINEQSASASEIVAGALQDLDRAVIVGRRSFGKGLVQSIFSLPYEGTLKMTTARYYTPSGRCIQKIDYSAKRMHILKKADSLRKIFYTHHGRPVEESNGILPDSVVPRPQFPKFVQVLRKHRMFFRFANFYLATHSIDSAHPVNATTLQAFTQFLMQERFFDKQSLPAMLSQARHVAEEEKYSDSLLTLLNAARRLAQAELRRLVTINQAIIQKQLQREFALRLYPKRIRTERSLTEDPDLRAATAILHSPARYSEILAGSLH